MQFSDFQLSQPLLRAVQAEGYVDPSPIQQQAMPPALAGHDVLGIAQTGTGKTATFALPILNRLSKTSPRSPRPIRTLVLAPTRELARQIGESFRAYGRHTNLRIAVVFGGVGQSPQVRELREGVDIVVACPGRLLDLIGQGHVKLGQVEVLVLDEADHMLDMGFIPDIRRILKHIPAERQTMMFSATMPDEIRRLADDMLRNPVRVEVAPVATPAERVEHVVYFVERQGKANLLRDLLAKGVSKLPGAGGDRVLVFTRTKRGADRVAKRLAESGVKAEAIHGDKAQGARERALANFRRGSSPVLVATDLAARGLDVDGISHVVNFDLPNEPETFVHRIGRTARAGASGVAVSFCDTEEGEYLADIEKLIRQRLPLVDEHPHHSHAAKASHQNHHARLAAKGQPQAPRTAKKSPAQPQGGGRSQRQGQRGPGSQTQNAHDGAPRQARSQSGQPRQGGSSTPRSQSGHGRSSGSGTSSANQGNPAQKERRGGRPGAKGSSQQGQNRQSGGRQGSGGSNGSQQGGHSGKGHNPAAGTTTHRASLAPNSGSPNNYFDGYERNTSERSQSR